MSIYEKANKLEEHLKSKLFGKFSIGVDRTTPRLFVYCCQRNDVKRVPTRINGVEVKASYTGQWKPAQEVSDD